MVNLNPYLSPPPRVNTTDDPIRRIKRPLKKPFIDSFFLGCKYGFFTVGGLILTVAVLFWLVVYGWFGRHVELTSAGDWLEILAFTVGGVLACAAVGGFWVGLIVGIVTKARYVIASRGQK